MAVKPYRAVRAPADAGALKSAHAAQDALLRLQRQLPKLSGPERSKRLAGLERHHGLSAEGAPEEPDARVAFHLNNLASPGLDAGLRRKVASGPAPDPLLRELARERDPKSPADIARQVLARTRPLEFLGDGVSFKVWANDEWVVKVARHVIPEEGVMPVPDPHKRQAIVDLAVEVTQALKASPRFRQFAHLIPDAFSPLPGILFQRRVPGVPPKDLVGLDEEEADWVNGTWRAIQRAAREAMPGIGFDASNANNLHWTDKTTPAGWFDPAWVSRKALAAWKPGLSLGRDLAAAADKLRDQRINREKWFPSVPRHVLGTAFAYGVTGPQGEALVVSNPVKNQAFLVPPSLKEAYTRHAPELGMPVAEAAAGPDGQLTQAFEHGNLGLQAGQPVGVQFAPGLADALVLLGRHADGAQPGTIAPLGGGWGRATADGYLVANPQAGQAFMIPEAFRDEYVSKIFRVSRGQRLDAVLGLPVEAARRADDGTWEQRFEHGTLVRPPGGDVQVTP